MIIIAHKWVTLINNCALVIQGRGLNTSTALRLRSPITQSVVTVCTIVYQCDPFMSNYDHLWPSVTTCDHFSTYFRPFTTFLAVFGTLGQSRPKRRIPRALSGVQGIPGPSVQCIPPILGWGQTPSRGCIWALQTQYIQNTTSILSVHFRPFSVIFWSFGVILAFSVISDLFPTYFQPFLVILGNIRSC